MGIKIAPPDINACDGDFTVDGERVRFGLAAVKGVGDKAVEAIVEARTAVGRFKDLYHFCENVDLRAVNRSTIEALIKCGAFDALGAHRAAMMAAAGPRHRAGPVRRRRPPQRADELLRRPRPARRPSRRPQFPDVEPLVRGPAPGGREGDAGLLRHHPPAGPLRPRAGRACSQPRRHASRGLDERADGTRSPSAA